MPPGVPAAVLLALMLLCFVLATVGWTKVAYSKTLPAPKHVLYLSNAYKPEYAAWETERLLRKMCLKLLCAFLPPSLSPSLHMTGASIILLASLGSYLLLSPYKVELWNRSESALLTLALVMTCLSSCLISNELDWGHSAPWLFHASREGDHHHHRHSHHHHHPRYAFRIFIVIAMVILAINGTMPRS